jgi:hypothetical protein
MAVEHDRDPTHDEIADPRRVQRRENRFDGSDHAHASPFRPGMQPKRSAASGSAKIPMRLGE